MAATTTQIEVATYVKTLTQLGYSFRLNECGDIVEVNDSRLEDIQLATIRARMRAQGFKVASAVEDVIKMQAGRNRYHPIKNYLMSAGTDYDGQQHIAFLTAHFKESTEPHKLFGLWLRKWLIGTVAKVMGGGDNQNAMLVIDGPQGIGKSVFAYWLCSPLPRYFIEGAINTDDKDSLIRLISNWIWEVSELGATTRRSDIESLKAFISQRMVTVRRPWGRMDMVKPAMASLIGTVNNSAGILADQTGNRRFLSSTIEEIDWNYSTAVEPNQVWGEAFTAYIQSEKWEPTADERQQLAENNDGFRVPNPVEGYLIKLYYIDPQDIASFTKTDTIVAKLQTQGYRASSSRAVAMHVAAALKEMRVKRGRRPARTGPRGYIGVRERP